MPANFTSIPAVILDWAGTTVDAGGMASVHALQSTFLRNGIPLDANDARLHMGLPKKNHLREILALESVSAAWKEAHGHAPGEKDLSHIYPQLEAAILAFASERSALIPGTLELVEWLRQKGIKVGSTTGYTSEMMAIVARSAAAQGYSPTVILTPDQVSSGRPDPYMIYANAVRLKAWPLSHFVKIGDTLSDIAEGRNAECWTVGVALSGNAVGLPPAEFAALGQADKAERAETARNQLSGADYVIDSIAEAVPVLQEIAMRIELGHRPTTA